MTHRFRDLLALEPLAADELSFLLDQSKPFQEIQQHPLKKLATLRGKTVALAFFETSTRTRISFGTAASRLGADTMNLQAEASSLKKGETLLDTVFNLNAMKPDCLVMRHAASGAPHYVARHLDIPVVNAGDGTHEHPSQGLLDALTIRDRLGTIKNLNVTILGDILHMLRVQTERLNDPPLSAGDYILLYQLNHERLRRANRDAIVLHPGPINRGIEITPEVADGPQSCVLEQVTNGVAVRMAILYLLISGATETDTHPALEAKPHASD